MTPARIEANRRNAQKSTGPRTAQGKAQSRMNSLRTGNHSPLYEDFYLTWLDAPPGLINRVGASTVSSHPLFAKTLDIFREAEASVAAHFEWRLAMAAEHKKRGFSK